MAYYYAMPSFEDFFGPSAFDRRSSMYRMRCGPRSRQEREEYEPRGAEPEEAGAQCMSGHPHCPPPPHGTRFPPGPPRGGPPMCGPQGPPPPPHGGHHPPGPPPPPGPYGPRPGPPPAGPPHDGHPHGPPAPHRHWRMESHRRRHHAHPRRQEAGEEGPSSFPGFGHVRLSRSGTAARLTILLPGISRDKVMLEVLKRTLTIEVPALSANHAAVFSRTFELGETIDADAIAANLDLGILTVTLPYKVKSATQPRRVAVSGAEASSQGKTASEEGEAATARSADLDEGAVSVQEMGQTSKSEWVDVREAEQKQEEEGGDEEHPEGGSRAGTDDEDGSIEDWPVDAEP